MRHYALFLASHYPGAPHTNVINVIINNIPLWMMLVAPNEKINRNDPKVGTNPYKRQSGIYIYSDGRHYSYDKIKESVKNEFFKGLKQVEIKCDTMNVQVLGSEKAACFAILHQTLLDSAGNTIKVRVEATFIGVKKEDI